MSLKHIHYGLVSALLYGGVLSQTGCMLGENLYHGYQIDVSSLKKVHPGDPPERVLELLGTPTTVSTVGNRTWYYINRETTRPFLFVNERTQEQHVVVVHFNKAFKVVDLALIGMKDGVLFDFVTRTTPTNSEDKNVLSNFFKGVSNYRAF